MPEYRLGEICYKIHDTKWFDIFIYSCIIFNTFLLTLSWGGQSIQFANALDILNLIFTGVFILEALIKIVAMRILYFQEMWNLFDLLIVIASLFTISLNYSTTSI